MVAFLDDLLDNLLSALGLSEPAGNWLSRLREEITLTAPDGTQFIARWRGSPRTITNKLGIHTFPGISGARVQDLRSGEEIYDLTLIFSGEQNDINSAAFLNALKNNEGDWQIEHPTKGPLFAIWMSVTENDFPVDSGNITVIQVPFIINLPDTSEEIAAQAQAQADSQAGAANDSAAGQFGNVADISSPGGIQSVINGVGKAITKAKKALKVIQNASILDPQILAILAAIENTIASVPIDLSALAGQFQAYIQIFGLGQTNSTDGVTMYSDFIDDVITDQPEEPNEEGVSTAAVTELVVTAALVGAGQMALIGGPDQAALIEGGALTVPITSRPQTITVVEKLNDLFENVTDGLDTIQALYADNPINVKYFSQSETYADAMLMIAEASKFLLISLFGLPSERRIILKEDTFVPQIAKNEMGSMGFPGDPKREFENVDIIILSNDLHGDDIYMLEAGREVLIYE